MRTAGSMVTDGRSRRCAGRMRLPRTVRHRLGCCTFLLHTMAQFTAVHCDGTTRHLSRSKIRVVHGGPLWPRRTGLGPSPRRSRSLLVRDHPRPLLASALARFTRASLMTIATIVMTDIRPTAWRQLQTPETSGQQLQKRLNVCPCGFGKCHSDSRLTCRSARRVTLSVLLTRFR